MNKLILALALMSPLAQASVLTSHVWKGEAQEPNESIQTGRLVSNASCQALMNKLYRATLLDMKQTFAGQELVFRKWIGYYGDYNYEIALRREGKIIVTSVAKCVPTTI